MSSNQDPRILTVLSWCARETGGAPHELECAELLRRLDAQRHTDPWVLTTERLPEDGERVELIFVGGEFPVFGWCQRINDLALFYVTERGHFQPRQVFCWRPARPIGALPEAKEKA